MASSVAGLAGYIFNSLPLWAEHVFDILTAVIMTVYFILEGDEVYSFMTSLVVPASRTRLSNTLLRAEERVSRWLIGQLALMASICVYSLVVFRILNVRYFLLLGILMGLTNIIPVAGNLVTMALVIMVAASDTWTKAGLVIAAYAIYVQFENAYLTPDDNSKVAETPEIGTGTGAWTALTGATSTNLFGAYDNRWWYPRAFNAPNGQPQRNLGPADNAARLQNYSAGMGDLLEAFDDQRLIGNLAPLPASLSGSSSGMVSSTSLPSWAIDRSPTSGRGAFFVPSPVGPWQRTQCWR